MSTVGTATAIIPARLAAVRLPRKPLLDVGGAPLIVRVCENARAVDLFARVVVATDTEEVADVTRAAGFEAVLTSPGHASGTDRVAEAARALGLADDAAVVNVQGDEPLVSREALAAVVATLRAHPGAVATAVQHLTDGEDPAHPDLVKVALGEGGRGLYFSRSVIPYLREDVGGVGGAGHSSARSPRHFRHVGLYGYAAATLRRLTALPPHPLEVSERLEQLRWLAHGYEVRCAVVDAHEPGVDSPHDLARVRAYYIAQR